MLFYGFTKMLYTETIHAPPSLVSQDLDLSPVKFLLSKNENIRPGPLNVAMQPHFDQSD